MTANIETAEAVFHTKSPTMQLVLDTVLAVAESDASILLRGESGTGKGVVARAIHERSRRKGKPFVTIHCPSLSPHLLESEMFGHAKGAFTGAVKSTEGKVAAADGGTLFLDEIGDLPLPLQPKLLRLVQDRTFERVGETKTRTADVRIVAATNRRIEEEVAAGRFREDLFYRLNVIDVTLPPLRERADDTLPLANELLALFNKKYGRSVTGFTASARERLANHSWPGNVRELRNAVERAVLLCREGTIDAKDLPLAVASTAGRPVGVGDEAPIDAVELEHIRRVLAASPTLEEAARTLGIDASTLYRKRKRYGL